MTETPWLAKARPAPRARLRLFCFPYAGGSAQIFRRWPEMLSAAIEVRPVQLPGRAPRIRETPFDDMSSLVDALLPALAAHLDLPFAFFGHSMGAGIAFELSRRLRRAGVEPAHLFVSGRRAPHLPDTERPLHKLPDQQFKDELRRLNGTPAEVLEHPELMEMMTPLLRADFTVSESYVCEQRPALSCPLTVFGGLRDDHSEPWALEGWREHTTGPFSMRMFDGDHFFINTEQAQVLRALEIALKPEQL